MSLFTLLLASFALAANPQGSNFISICYHDVAPNVAGNPFSVRTKDLIEQFEYLKAHYNVVSLKDVIEAHEGKKALPDRAVLLTVDDGLASFYTDFFPLLRLYGFPAVFGIVGRWTTEGIFQDYGMPKVKDPATATWKQLKEMSDSGLVDIASHTFDMHRGHLFNPQGNEGAMAGFFAFDPVSGSYESEEAFKARLRADLKKNNLLLKKHIGRGSPAMVWPYGSFNGLSAQVATEESMPIQFSVQEGMNNTNDIRIIRRGMVMAGMEIHDFADLLERAFVSQDPVRALGIDLDSLWSENPQERELRLGALLERVREIGANTVYLNAFSADGTPYFPIPGQKSRDLLNRVAHSMARKTKAMNVYAILQNHGSLTPAGIRALAKHTDLNGVVFTSDPGPLVAAAREMRPLWIYGRIASAAEAEAVAKNFDQVIVSLDPIKNQELLKNLRSEKIVLDLDSSDLTAAARAALSQGKRHLAYSISRSTDNNLLRSELSGSGNPFSLYKGEIK